MKRIPEKHNTKTHARHRACVSLLLLGLLFGTGCASLSPAVPKMVAAEVYATVVPTASPEPVVTPEPIFVTPGYFPTEEGWFVPERTITASEAETILATAAGRYTIVSSDVPLDEAELEELIAGYFSAEKASDAVNVIRGMGESAVSRAEAAVCFNRLFGFPASEEGAYCPDVPPEHWAYREILTAASPADTPRLAEGFLMRDGELYCADSRGYIRRNAYVGSLFFGADGRYTSGDAELDALVTKVIRENTAPSMARGEMLRAVYEHIRDDYLYLKRNYYRMGEGNWGREEARAFFTDGRGNCYGYAAAFWAAARALGYEAQIVSGFYGEDSAPHGWVEIWQGGTRFTYDVEIEMTNVRHDNPDADFFALTDEGREDHHYVEYDYTDAVIPRDADGVTQR